MTANTCATGCSRPTRNQRLLCDHHVWELEQALKNLPDRLVDLHNALTQQTKLGEGRAGGVPTKAAEHPLPFNVRASEMAADLRAFLVGWVRDLHESYEQRPLPENSLPAMAKWLRSRVDILAVHPAADDIHTEIVGAYQEAERVVDVARNRSRFVVGPCPELDAAAACIGDVWAYIPTSEDKQAVMVCAHCGATWETYQWLRAGRRILDVVKQRERLVAQRRAIFGEEAPA